MKEELGLVWVLPSGFRWQHPGAELHSPPFQTKTLDKLLQQLGLRWNLSRASPGNGPKCSCPVLESHWQIKQPLLKKNNKA